MGRIRQPGTASNITLLTSGVLTIIQLLFLIGGHLLLAFEIYFRFFGSGKESLKGIADLLSLPEWSLWVTIGIALLMDAWIIYHDREARKKANKR